MSSSTVAWRQGPEIEVNISESGNREWVMSSIEGREAGLLRVSKDDVLSVLGVRDGVRQEQKWRWAYWREVESERMLSRKIIWKHEKVSQWCVDQLDCRGGRMEERLGHEGVKGLLGWSRERECEWEKLSSSGQRQERWRGKKGNKMRSIFLT